MTIADFEAYVSTHLAAAEQDVKDAFEKVVAFVKGKEAAAIAQIEAEVTHLTGLRYTVIAPAEPVVDAPVAAEAAPAAPAA